MFRFASGQLVLLALTACVGAQSSGFLKPPEVVSVLQQDPAATSTAPQEDWASVEAQWKANDDTADAKSKEEKIMKEIEGKEANIKELRKLLHGPVGYAIDGTATAERDAQYKAANAKLNAHHQMAVDIVKAARELEFKKAEAQENAHLFASYRKLQERQKKEKALSKIAMDRYSYVMRKKYACTTDSNQQELKRMLVSKRSIATQNLLQKQRSEIVLFRIRRKCMVQVRGDQSVPYETYSGNDQKVLKKREQLFKDRARVARCMNVGKNEAETMAETIPVVATVKKPSWGKSWQLNEEVTVKKQTDSSQQMQEHAVIDDFEGLSNTLQKFFDKHEQKQLEDTWEKEIKNTLPKCDQSTGTDQKVVDVKEKEAKAVDDTD